jgi:hypothetical protein
MMRAARWGLPWLAILAISASGAYGMTAAVAHQPLAGVSRTAACDISGGRLLYVGLNSWVPAEPRVAPCPDTVP